MTKKRTLRTVKTCLLMAALCTTGAWINPATAATPPVAVTQQTGTVQGTVSDASGPVVGASVLVKGSTNGTVTDLNGHFKLQGLKHGDRIQVSFVGYITQEVVYKGEELLNITLKEDAQTLEDVVVVGYGTQKKINMTGSVAQIDSKTLENRPIPNVSSVLQGVMPGVQVTSGQGRPGQDGATIRVRGVGTLNSASPYILVDGVETGTMNSIDPNDVESISVLKDAASAAIYGSKASNGVILITTKRGKSGKPRISYSGYAGIQNATALVERMSSYDYARLFNMALEDVGRKKRFSDEDLQKFKDGSSPYTHPNTNWYKEAYRTGFQHSHNININGGTEDVRYMASVGYLKQNGILPNAARQQFNGRTNLDMKVNSKLGLRLNMAYIRNSFSDPNASYNGGSSDQIIRQLNRIAPWIVARYEDGTYGAISDGSPLAWLDAKQTVDQRVSNFSGTLAADYEIIEGLKATLSGSWVDNVSYYNAFQKFIQYNANAASEPNKLNESSSFWNRSTLDALLNYEKNFEAHGLKAMAGWHAEKYNYRGHSGERKNFPTNDLTDMNVGDASTQKNGGYSRELAMLSWFGRLNYDYAGRYLFEANMRADASSRFARGHRWGYFPSFSAAWRLSEEPFMEPAKEWVNNLKIRASWGLLGNQEALSDFYPWLNTYELNATYPIGGTLRSGYYQYAYKLETITWEKARTYGVGLDATLLNKLNLTLDYYNRKTTGILMNVPVPEEFGLAPYKDNVGAMLNRGVEVMIGYNDRWGDFSFGLTANVAYNQNKILDLGGVDAMPNGNTRHALGERFNSYYAYKTEGFFNSDEEAKEWQAQNSKQAGYPFGNMTFKGGDLKYADTNGDGKITADDRTFIGSTNPAVTYGLTLNAGYKDFDLSMVFAGAGGVYRMINREVTGYFNGDDSSPATAWLKAWTPENKNAKMPRVAYDVTSPSLSSNVVSDFWIQNATYLRMKNLQFGYTLPKGLTQRIGMQTVRFYYSAENLFTLHNMLVNVDPEIPSERGSNFPLTRTQSIGVNITF